MRKPSVLIVGGGAAGLPAAIAAARLGAAVTVLEATARVGKKVLASGNGRCNLSNLSVTPGAYNQPAFVEPVLQAYPCDRIRSFFAGMGLLSYADDEGRVFPVTNTATSVLDVLRLEAGHLDVEERCRFEALGVSEAGGGRFEVSSRDGETAGGDAIVVTTGGGRSCLAGLGHAQVPYAPVLAPLRTDAEPIRGLSGVRVRCAATLLAHESAGRPLASERGELLFRERGVSGIMVFELSRYLEPGCVLSIDLFPDVDEGEMAAMIAERCDALSWRTAETFFSGMLHPRVARALLRAADVGPDTAAAELPQARLAALLKDFRLAVLGIEAGQAQVTRGGAAVAEFDPETMASRLADGVFAAGEVLDVDGRSGGFNLHWAWASGIVAGEAAARRAQGRAAGGGEASPGPA